MICKHCGVEFPYDPEDDSDVCLDCLIEMMDQVEQEVE